MQPKWRTVPGHPDYEASDRGAVRRRTPGRSTYVGRVLNPSLNDGGYLYVSLNTERVAVHRVVCRTFHGPAPSTRHEATHRNGKKLDNRDVNLRWRTHRQNIADKVRHGTVIIGTRHHAAKLTPAKVRRIRVLVPVIGLTATGARYGITKQAVALIINGKNWRHVK